MCELWRWLATSWGDIRTVYSITALSGCGKSSFLGDVATCKDNLPVSEPIYSPDSACRSLEVVKASYDMNDATRKPYRYRSWDEVVDFAKHTVVFGISFNSNMGFSIEDVRLSQREGAELFPLLSRIIYCEHCDSRRVPWAAFLAKFKEKEFGACGDVNVDVVQDEVLRILRNKRGNPDAPSLLLVDELGKVGYAFEPYRQALYGYCASVDSFRLLFSSMEVAFLDLLRDPVEAIDEYNFRLKGSPTVVSTATTVPLLPEAEVMKALVERILNPGLLMFSRAGRVVTNEESARSIAAFSGGIGRYLSYALEALLQGAQGYPVYQLLLGASSSKPKGMAPGSASFIIANNPTVQAVLITGIEVEARSLAAIDHKGRPIVWEKLISTGEFGATADARDFFRDIAVPTLAIIEATNHHKKMTGLMALSNSAETAVKLQTKPCCMDALGSMMLGMSTGGTPHEAAELYHYWWEVAASRARELLCSLSGPMTAEAKFSSLPLRQLYPDSLPVRRFGGPCRDDVCVDASRARKNTVIPIEFKDTIEDLVSDKSRDELLDNVWRSPAGYIGVDCLVFYNCTQGVAGGPRAGELVCVAINNKDSSPSASTSVELDAAVASYESLEKSFGLKWGEWADRVAHVVVANRDTVTEYYDFRSSVAASRTLVCL
eukprot:contig_2831_g573